MLLIGNGQLLRVVIPVTAGDVRVSGSRVTAPTPFTPSSNSTPVPWQNPLQNTATTLTPLFTSPSVGFVDNVLQLNVENASASVSQPGLRIERNDGSNTDILWSGTLLTGERVALDENGQWTHYDAGGDQKFAQGSGQFIASTLLTAASGNFTTGPNTRKIKIRGVGGGGAGAGCTSVAAAASAGGGGSAGGYAEKTFDVSPSTAYAYVCGTAGAGASGAAGGNGGNSTFIVGATTVTASAGQGAPVATAVTTLSVYRGGTAAAVSTNGDLNSGGEPGQAGVVVVVATPLGVSGPGGSSEFGSGGSPLSAVGNGIAALGFGAGGGGALTGASAVRTGGNGTAGCWAVDEFT